jgi:hypothetical protein
MAVILVEKYYPTLRKIDVDDTVRPSSSGQLLLTSNSMVEDICCV